MRRLLTTAALATLVLLGHTIFAQVDTTPPVLVGVMVHTPILDNTTADAQLLLTVEVEDDLAGFGPNESASLSIRSPDGNYTVSGAGCSFLDGTTLAASFRCTRTIPRFTAQGIWTLGISVRDALFNSHNYSTDELSALGFPSSFEVTNLGGEADVDADGVPDVIDNCPNDPNPNQEDRDLDLIGDACDPFPDDRDNEQAQCETDLTRCQSGALLFQCREDLATCDATATQCAGELGQCTSDLGLCQADLASEQADTDGDGRRDLDDRCPGTGAGAEVDLAGCSLTQFCAGFDASTREGPRLCKAGDWKNDEPKMRSRERDCAVDVTGVCAPAAAR